MSQFIKASSVLLLAFLVSICAIDCYAQEEPVNREVLKLIYGEDASTLMPDLTVKEIFTSCQMDPEGFTDYLASVKKYADDKFQSCLNSLFNRHLARSKKHMDSCKQYSENQTYMDCVTRNTSSYIVEWISVVNHMLKSQGRFEDTRLGSQMITGRRLLRDKLGDGIARQMINSIGPQLSCN